MQTIVHIGMHKTGTTFLQKEVFPKCTNFHHLHNKSLRSIYHPSKGGSKQHLLVSDELLSGNPYDENTFDDFKLKMDIIRDMFGDPKILVAFRKHGSYVTSIYNQYLQQGNNMDMPDFFNLKNTGLLKIEDVTYVDRINYLKELFSDVTIYTYDDFKSAPQSITEQICTRLGLTIEGAVNYGIQHNQSISSAIQHKTIRRLNRLNSILGGILTNKYFKRWNLTPRKIAQRRLKGVESKKWAPDKSYITEIEQHFEQDWETVLQQVSIKL